MKKYQYKCTLLSDVIITSMAATEGYQESLDYIPGSKFLGIIAGKLYDENNEEKTLNLFHNGKVRFGDAAPVLNQEVLLKVPFSWYHEKDEKLTDKIYLHHKNLEQDGMQLKQARSGYFSERDKTFTSVEQDFSLKSAQDPKKRKSKDGQMFGYYSLKAGTEWTFIVTDEEGKYSEEIKSLLVGKQRIGRSRSAEFGLVEIEFVKEVPPEKIYEIDGEVIIYAQSNLCFYDENTGQSTAQPSALQLTGNRDTEIIWEKCQIRSRNYKTWNRHRNNKDAERVVIERGSVFILRLKTAITSNYFTNGIGAHKNEGFGSVLINPSFLSSETNQLIFKLVKKSLDHFLFYPVEKGGNDEEILSCLKNIKSRNNFETHIDEKVNGFIEEFKKKFKGISKSQWGTLRNYGKNLENKEHFKKLIFDKESGFLYKGQSEFEWRTNNRRVILEKHLETLDARNEYLSFVVKLSNQMAKN